LPADIDNHSPAQHRDAILALAALVFTLFLTLLRYRPPEPKPADAPADQFSALRARGVLDRLVGDGAPHPVGTEANARVRERVLKEFAGLGFSPEVQEGFACNEFGVCAHVRNVLARLQGQRTRPALLLAAHYDSVAAGPGASDDAAGVAVILEMARILRSGALPAYPIIFLIDDGEEPGMLGARAFFAHPWAAEARYAINLEARGTSGPSLMLETSSNNAWLIKLYAASVPRPITSSLFYTLYKQLPNDTDFTVFKARGLEGFNLAYIGGASRYHTPLDNVGNTSLASLQHQGENALALVRALENANADLDRPHHGAAVFFDVFSRWTIWWPLVWTYALALLTALLWAGLAATLLRRQAVTVRAILWGAIVWLASLATSLALALALRWPMRAAGVLPPGWLAQPLPAVFAFWAIGFVTPGMVTFFLGRRAGFWGLWLGVWSCWLMLAEVLAFAAPGTSYLFLVPTLVAGIAGMAAMSSPSERAWSFRPGVLVLAMVTGALWFPVLLLTYDALGTFALPLLAVTVSMLATTLAPLLGAAAGRLPRLLSGIAAVLAVAAGAIAFFVSPYAALSPRPMNIMFAQDAPSETARWLVDAGRGQIPETMGHAAAFSRQAAQPFPWTGWNAIAAPAPWQKLPAPTLDIAQAFSQGRMRHIRATLRSPRGASEATLLLPPQVGLESVDVEGQRVPEQQPREVRWNNGWRVYTCRDLPPQGCTLEMVFSGAPPAEVAIQDVSPGLPQQARALLTARPTSATTIQSGDVTVVTRRVRLAGE